MKLQEGGFSISASREFSRGFGSELFYSDPLVENTEM